MEQIQALLAVAISIHAPSRERLNPITPLSLFEKISIHAPSRERRIFGDCMHAGGIDFNPRSLAGATD